MIYMREKSMRFGDFLRKIRLKDKRELRQSDVAKELEMSLGYYSDIENNRRHPFDPERMEKFIKLFELTEDEQTRMFDLASYENHEIPLDIEDILMYEEVGTLARMALRESKAGNADEEDWKRFIREIEEKKEKKEKGEKEEKKE